MASFFSYLTKHPFPSKKAIVAVFAPKKSFHAAVAWFFVLLTIACAYVTLLLLNNRLLVTVPARGGNLTEGIIGTPHLPSPNTSDDTLLRPDTPANQALLQLTEAGLLVRMPDGSLVPELASSYAIAPDGLQITFSLQPSAHFADNAPISSDDIARSLKEYLARNAEDRDLSAYWQAVTIATPNSTTISFASSQASTIASIPSHATFPVTGKHGISSGAFRLDGIEYSRGIPSKVTLKRNARYVRGAPLLSTLTLAFFPNQQALLDAIANGDVDMTADIDGATLLPSEKSRIAKDFSILPISNGKTVSIFKLNSEQIDSIKQSVDKKNIVAIVENGYGITTDTSASAQKSASTLSDTTKKNKVLAIAVANDTTTVAAGRALAAQLMKAGIITSINVFDPGTFQEKVRQQKYSVILATTPDISIPSGYDLVMPLYTQATPYIARTTAGNTLDPTIPLTNKAARYATAYRWYSNTDKIWKWLMAKNNHSKK